MKPQDNDGREFLDLLAEEFTSRRRRGETPTIDEYVSRYPGRAREIRQFLAALDHVEAVHDEPESLPTPSVPHTIGGFHIVRELGRGGMGVVYEAIETNLDRRVALKVLGRAAPRFLARFHREAQAAARLHHPGIVPVHGVHEDAGVHFYVMQYVEGRGLDHLLGEIRWRVQGRSRVERTADALHILRKHGASGDEYPRVVAHLGLEVAEALAHAHAHGILHRDIKPSNILIDARGHCQITDFGLCKTDESADITQVGDVVGTLRYMAPERFRGQSDVRCDVYSLGVTLHELITLESPVERDPRRPPVPLFPRRNHAAEIPRDLRVIVERAIEVDPEKRYPTAAAVAADLRAHLAGRPIAARHPSIPYLLWLAVRRNQVLTLTIASAAAVLLLVSALYVVKLRTALEAKNRSLRHARALGLSSSSAAALRSDPLLGLLLAREAVQLECSAETVSTLHQALASLHERAELTGHEGPLLAAFYDATGSRILTLSPQRAQLWDTPPRDSGANRIAVLGPQERNVESRFVAAAFSPRGHRIVIAEASGLVRLLNGTGECVATVPRYRGTIHQLLFAPTEDRIAIAGTGNPAVTLLDLDGNTVAAFGEGPDRVPSLEFSSDGQAIVLAWGGSDASVWSSRGELVATLRLTDERIFSASFSPTRDRIVTTGRRNAHLWDQDGQLLATLEGHDDWVNVARFSPDGSHVVTTSSDQSVGLWDRDGTSIAFFRGHGGGVTDAAFSPGGEWIISASLDQTLRLWDFDGNTLAVLRGHASGVSAVEFSPDGTRILTASADQTARIWGLGLEEMPVFRGHDRGLYTAVFSPDGENILTASRDGTARLWRSDGTVAATLENARWWFYSASFTADGERILTTSEGLSAAVWNRSGERLAHFDRLGGRILYLAQTDGGLRILTRSGGRGVKLWDETGRVVAEFTGHEAWVWTAVYDASRRQVLTASADRTARLWSEEGQPLVVFRGHQAAVRSAIFSADGERILTASDDGTAVLWDRNGTEIAVCRGHEGAVLGVAFSPDGQRVATASRDHTARLWNNRGDLLARLEGHEGVVWSVDFDPQGRRLITASFDRTARIWLVDPEELLRVAQRRAFRAFTADEMRRYHELLGTRP